MLLRPGPILALMSAKFSAEEEKNSDEVPRIYIKTTCDNVVKTEQQDAMIKRWPPLDVYVLESDHSPFFSSPFVLFGLLLKAAALVASQPETNFLDRIAAAAAVEAEHDTGTCRGDGEKERCAGEGG